MTSAIIAPGKTKSAANPSPDSQIVTRLCHSSDTPGSSGVNATTPRNSRYTPVATIDSAYTARLPNRRAAQLAIGRATTTVAMTPARKKLTSPSSVPCTTVT